VHRVSIVTCLIVLSVGTEKQASSWQLQEESSKIRILIFAFHFFP